MKLVTYKITKRFFANYCSTQIQTTSLANFKLITVAVMNGMPVQPTQSELELGAALSVKQKAISRLLHAGLLLVLN
jgi:hypothetical protein